MATYAQPNTQNYQYPSNTQYPNYPQPAPNVQYAPNTTYVYVTNAPPQTAPIRAGQRSTRRQYKPQSNAVGAATFIFMSGGMNMSWSFNAYNITKHLRICWFIAAIIGALIGAVLTSRIPKKLIFLFSATLVVIGGILFTSLPNDFDAMIAARYLDGFANGLTIVAALVAVGEVTVKGLRGMIASSTEATGFALGFYVQLIYVTSWNYDINYSFTINQTHGALLILFGALAALGAAFLTIESPIFHLLHNDETTAIDCLRRLHRPTVITSETYQLLEEHKSYVALNNEMSIVASLVSGLPALIKLCIHRGMIAINFSMLVYLALNVSAAISNGTAIWPGIVCGSLRWLAVLFTSFVLDSAGRKKTMLFSILLCGGLAVAIAIFFYDAFNTTNAIYTNMSVAVYLIFAFQFLAGVFATSSSAYLSEAFPLAIKSCYIAISFSVEMLVHIIIILSVLSGFTFSVYFCFVAAICFAFFLLGLFFMPETKQLTLRECQAKFSSCFQRGMN